MEKRDNFPFRKYRISQVFNSLIHNIPLREFQKSKGSIHTELTYTEPLELILKLQLVQTKFIKSCHECTNLKSPFSQVLK